ncbi:MAG: RES family NAD+ phosphorylase [Gammaproteobacteria bacterium]|nr:RES family NAD+ phosphorylase [Gammaproteobacteria bacterium]
MKPYDHRIFTLLDSVPPRAIKTWIKLHDNVIDYTAEHFAYFAHRRSQVMEQLKQSLLDNTTSFEFNGWRRIVSQQFSNTPLSTIGSIKSFPGGRFNIGVIDIERFPQFAALYLAEDTTTAFLEMTGLKSENVTDGLTAKELAVAGNFSSFVIRGKLFTVLDLTNPESLQEFCTHLKGIQLPFYYTKKAAQLKIPTMLPIKNLSELRKTLLLENWRLMPMQFDVPANSQVLGQIAHSAGIEAILYPSVKTNKKALAIYPENFADSDASIEITGNVANTVLHTRIDKNTYKNFLP